MHLIIYILKIIYLITIIYQGSDFMELTKIKGNSYYINFPTNIGVYIFKNKNCLLIDTGKINMMEKNRGGFIRKWTSPKIYSKHS